MAYEDITVIIPTLNEEKNINKLITQIANAYPKINIFVADDGSSDNTQKIVRECSKKNHAIQLIDRKHEPMYGLSASILDALQRVKTKFFIVIDGDFQHPPEKIESIAEKLRRQYDVVVGIRAGVVAEWGWFRRLESYIATCLAFLRTSITGTPCKDLMSGFFGARTEIFQQTYQQKPKSFVPEGYKILFDFLKVSKNVKIAYIPYIFGIRREGKSKIGSKHVFYFLKSLFK